MPSEPLPLDDELDDDFDDVLRARRRQNAAQARRNWLFNAVVVGGMIAGVVCGAVWLAGKRHASDGAGGSGRGGGAQSGVVGPDGKNSKDYDARGNYIGPQIPPGFKEAIKKVPPLWKQWEEINNAKVPPMPAPFDPAGPGPNPQLPQFPREID